MLPPWGCLAASRPSQEPPFQSRRPWARDYPQVGEGPAQGARASRGSRRFFWNPPDSDLALAEVLAQEPRGWVRGLGSPLVPCAGRLPDVLASQLSLVSLLAGCSVLSHQMSCLGAPEAGLPLSGSCKGQAFSGQSSCKGLPTTLLGVSQPRTSFVHSCTPKTSAESCCTEKC